MFAVFKVQQCPQLLVASQYNGSTTASITTVRATLGYEFFPSEMDRSRSALTAFAVDLYVVNKIGLFQSDSD